MSRYLEGQFVRTAALGAIFNLVPLPLFLNHLLQQLRDGELAAFDDQGGARIGDGSLTI